MNKFCLFCLFVVCTLSARPCMAQNAPPGGNQQPSTPASGPILNSFLETVQVLDAGTTFVVMTSGLTKNETDQSVDFKLEVAEATVNLPQGPNSYSTFTTYSTASKTIEQNGMQQDRVAVPVKFLAPDGGTIQDFSLVKPTTLSADVAEMRIAQSIDEQYNGVLEIQIWVASTAKATTGTWTLQIYDFDDNKWTDVKNGAVGLNTSRLDFYGNRMFVDPFDFSRYIDGNSEFKARVKMQSSNPNEAPTFSTPKKVKAYTEIMA